MRRICIAGIGALGGMLSAMLGQKYAESMTLIARGERAESLRKHGVILHSTYYGEKTARIPNVVSECSSLPLQDIVIIAVKNYSLSEIADTLEPAIGENTVILPVLNGTEAGDWLRLRFPQAIVGDALMYTTTGANADYSITQRGPYTYLYMGSKVCWPEEKMNRIREVYELLLSVGFDVRWSDRIESEIWQKFILNCAFNTVTARYVTDSGTIRADPVMRDQVYHLLKEAYEVGVSEGVELPENLVETKYRFMMEKQDPSGTSSMRRDVEAKRKTELDAFTGAVLRKAEAHHLEVPYTRKMHQALLSIIREE